MNELTKQLLAKAHERLGSADILTTLADLDSAVARLYDAMCYAAQAALASRGLVFKSEQLVLSAFDEHLIKTGELDAVLHRWLIDARQLVDNAPEAAITEDDISELKLNAADFVERIALWLQGRERVRGTKDVFPA